ncbi:hypothetical protein GmHk_08G023696 [Glycine max]|nr:hypothetical protein GmHk_08G023696 [Glycine max]
MTRLDELLQCITIVEHNQNSPASSSSTNPAPSPSPTPHLHHIKLKAMPLSRLQEEKLNEHCQMFRSKPSIHSSAPPNYHPIRNPTQVPSLPSPPKPPPVPRKRLTLKEMARGLCFNCDKKFS